MTLPPLTPAEAANDNNLRIIRSSSHLGWQGRNLNEGFLCGRTHILPNGELADGDDAAAIQFRGLTPGDEQIRLA